MSSDVGPVAGSFFLDAWIGYADRQIAALSSLLREKEAAGDKAAGEALAYAVATLRVQQQTRRADLELRLREVLHAHL